MFRAMFLLALMTCAAHAESGLNDKARLQAATRAHIERALVDGAYLDVDMKTGVVRKLYMSEPHIMVLALGDVFVLCAELRDAQGGKTPIDVYLAPRDDGFAVFRTDVGNRGALMELVRKGIARPFG